VNRIGRAGGVGEVGSGGARVHVDDVLLLGDAVHRQRHAGGQHAEDAVHLFLIGPLARDVHAHVRLVLVIGRDHVDLPALRRHAGILDGHLRGEDRALPAHVRIEARHVVEHADLYVFILREGCARKGQRGDERQSRNRGFHCFLPDVSGSNAQIVVQCVHIRR
jgi:hypothetical protein